MSMFTRQKPRQLEPTDDVAPYPLPEGFDNPDGPFFVPEELRELWAIHAGSVDVYELLAETSRVIAEGRVHQYMYPERYKATKVSEWMPDPDTGEMRQVRGEVPGIRLHPREHAVATARRGGHAITAQTDAGRTMVRRVMREQHEELTEHAEHAIRLEAVTNIRTADQKREIDQQRERRALLCPVCGEADADMGRPCTRDIVPPGAQALGRRIRLHSCAGCYLAALRYLTEQHALAPVGDWPQRTRVQHVQAYFQGKGN